MSIPIARGDKVTWESGGKTYTGIVEVRIDAITWVRVLLDDGRRLFALRKQLTRVEKELA